MTDDQRSPDFITALARGLRVIASFSSERPSPTLAELAAATDVPRPTVRRILLTLTELGYVRPEGRGYALTPRVMDLGMAYVDAQDLWSLAEDHLRRLVERTHESSSMAQLDGSDIVYVARVAIPKIIALQVRIGTRFPAVATSMGKVLLAALEADQREEVLARASQSRVVASRPPAPERLADELATIAERGWALADEELASGVRSIAAPVRSGCGDVVAAVNVTVHAAETSVDRLLGDHLPHLLDTAAALSADLRLTAHLPSAVVGEGDRLT